MHLLYYILIFCIGVGEREKLYIFTFMQ